MKFYRCNLDGQTINVISDITDKTILNNINPINNDEVPIYTYNEHKELKQVGSVARPLNKTRFIKWIIIVTRKRNYLDDQFGLTKSNPFNKLIDNAVEAIRQVYAYCEPDTLYQKEINNLKVRTL